MASVKSIYIFSGGSVAAFDYEGHQIPDLQKDFAIMLLEYWESKGFHPNEFGEINIIHLGKDCKLIPYKTAEGWNYEIVNK